MIMIILQSLYLQISSNLKQSYILGPNLSKKQFDIFNNIRDAQALILLLFLYSIVSDILNSLKKFPLSDEIQNGAGEIGI